MNNGRQDMLQVPDVGSLTERSRKTATVSSAEV